MFESAPEGGPAGLNGETSDTGDEAAFFFRPESKNNRPAIIARRAMPPTTLPAIGPALLFLLLEVVLEVEPVVAEPVAEDVWEEVVDPSGMTVKEGPFGTIGLLKVRVD